MLIFAAMINQRRQQQMQNTTALLAIDRRNGRVVWNERLHVPTHCFTIVGDPGKNKTVDMQLLNCTVRLTFTDQPLPASAVTSPAKTTTATKALFNALRRAALGRSGDDDEDDDPEPAVPVPAAPPANKALPPAPGR